MLIVLSPAKSLDFAPAAQGIPVSMPRLADETASLARVTKRLKARDLSDLMHISPALAALNVERFKAFDAHAQDEGTKQAVLAFNGDVYRGLDATTLDTDGLAFAQDHVRILSGLYGLLRPLDAIMPHRLEMGTKLVTRRGESLYDWWGSKIARLLKADMEATGGPLINLASIEYFGAVDRRALNAPVITPHFKEFKNGKAKIISFYAKAARGRMARYVIDHRITDVDALKGFNWDGYAYEAGTSTSTDWVFTRPQPDAK
jgi:uncharacterized protein